MKKIVLATIRFYQTMISPLIGKRCRFYPSCSQYGFEAIETQGVIQGMSRLTARLLKCHPFHPGGYDPLERS